MPQYQTVYIPGEGDVDFPIDMSDDDIASAITEMRQEPLAPPVYNRPAQTVPFDAVLAPQEDITPPEPKPEPIVSAPPVTNLPFAGAVGYEPQIGPPRGWQGPEPPAATAVKEFLGRSMIAPGFQEEMGKKIEERRKAPRDIPMMRFGEPGPVPGFEKETIGPVQAGLAKGMAGMVEHLTTPTSIATMSLLPAVYGVPFFKVLIEAGFSATMISHVIDETPELVKRLKEGDLEGAVEKAVEVSASAGLAALTGRGAFRTVKSRLYDPVQSLRAKRAAEAKGEPPLAEPVAELPGKVPLERQTQTPAISQRVQPRTAIERPKQTQTIEVPGEGPVEFPASMSDTEIAQAITTHLEAKPQMEITGVEEFQRESRLKDDKAKLDLAAKTPAGEFGVRGPLFQTEKQLDLTAAAPTTTPRKL